MIVIGRLNLTLKDEIDRTPYPGVDHEKASSGETWDWFLFQAFHPTGPHNASLHLLCDFDPLRLDVATRHSQGHAPLTHIAQQIFLPLGIEHVEFRHGKSPVLVVAPIEFPHPKTPFSG